MSNPTICKIEIETLIVPTLLEDISLFLAKNYGLLSLTSTDHYLVALTGSKSKNPDVMRIAIAQRIEKLWISNAKVKVTYQ
jgi:hypothetical protein